jgi:hypothetical protein
MRTLFPVRSQTTEGLREGKDITVVTNLNDLPLDRAAARGVYRRFSTASLSMII